MRAWSEISPTDAVLELRCPENAYLSVLRERFSSALASGGIVVHPPVPEADLVRAATSADVGIIPYVGPNLNHLYACPNKLSQYMHAGLAILANDLVFVGEVVRRYDCGAVYRAEEPSTLVNAVRSLVADRGRVSEMKRNAYSAFMSEFNWAAQAVPYRELLAEALKLDRV